MNYSKETTTIWHRTKYTNDSDYKEQKLASNDAWRKANQSKKTEGLRRRRERNKQDRIEYLGGKCVGCGTTENLQFDHKDRTIKEYNISHKPDHTLDKIKPELDKCQLLCKCCHAIKTRENHDNAELLKGYDLKSITDDVNTIAIVYQKS